jgi:hypothetical protein
MSNQSIPWLRSDMQKQTFARKLWLALLPRLVSLAAIGGFDAWLLRHVHRAKSASRIQA